MVLGISIFGIFGQVMAKNGVTIFGHSFLGHNSVSFRSIGLKFFMGAQETNIYRLVI